MTPATNPGRWAIVRGLCAWHLGVARGANPEPAGSPAARCWDHGHQVIGRHRGQAPGRNVARETAPGRGRAWTGDRGEWSEADIELLVFCSTGQGPVEARDVAAMTGRPEQGVRVKRTRLRKEGRLP